MKMLANMLDTSPKIKEEVEKAIEKKNQITVADVLMDEQDQYYRFDHPDGAYYANDLVVYDTNITTLADKCPVTISGSFICSGNDLTTLEGELMKVGSSADFSANKITSLKGIGRKYLKEIDGRLFISKNPIKSNVLGLLFVKKLVGVTCNKSSIDHGDRVRAPWVEFINDYITKYGINRTIEMEIVMRCQSEMIDAGLTEFAKL
jgi:hypothetical protein